MEFVFQMKQHSRLILITSLLVIFFNILPMLVCAQIDPGEDPDAPIDGGIGFLIVAGVGYGVKKVKDSKRLNKISSK